MAVELSTPEADSVYKPDQLMCHDMHFLISIYIIPSSGELQAIERRTYHSLNKVGAANMTLVGEEKPAEVFLTDSMTVAERGIYLVTFIDI